MRLHLEQHVAAPPETLWPHVTEPARMNRWSLATISAGEPGDGGGLDGIGAQREVRLRTPLGPVRLREVIWDAAPPARLVYRVVAEPPLRRHRGELRLEPAGGGTRLTWDVEAELLVPGLGAAMAILLRRQLARSLAELAALAARGELAARAPSPAPRPDPDEGLDLAPLYQAAAAVAEEQRHLADQLTEARDPKRWFSRVYQFVTEEQLAACRRGEVRHPAWVLRLVPIFHDYYEGSLRRHRGEAPGRPEAHWATAFRRMEAPAEPGLGLFLGLLAGVRAHVEEDLPRALGEVYLRAYDGRCDYARFRADYLLMGDIFGAASDRLRELIPREHLPASAKLLGPPLPRELREALSQRRFYDMPRRRRVAFERGERLVAFARRLHRP